ncbi:HAD hydrolase-like protein [Temperatibacter marinus]|uniref:HAD hydrolase-like protein n=1 Tax=Temperatibacter marinus TaxID=1456591 RepID=A0AA52HA70_9PROT|nr:HAD hydrolase-like protein [Temperatibacter marinus]WND03669.1 HAD hydrolase-like protein [Temperatibacter marinus]
MHLILFDVDGTLVNSQSFSDTLFKRAIEECLEIDSPDDWEGISHLTGTGILAEVYMKAKEEALSEKKHDLVRDHYLDLVMEKLMDEPTLCPAISGGPDLVNRCLSNENYVVAFTSGDWGPSACFKLSSAGYDISKAVIASSDDHYDRMEILLLARERAEEMFEDGEGFETITYVGDSKWDMLAAEGLGWRFIGLGDLVSDAEMHVTSFEQSQALVMGLN